VIVAATSEQMYLGDVLGNDRFEKPQIRSRRAWARWAVLLCGNQLRVDVRAPQGNLAGIFQHVGIEVLRHRFEE